MHLEAKTPTETRLKAYLDENASEALREKIAALPDRFNLDAAWRFIQEEARKQLKNKSGFLEDEVVFGWLVHYYEDVAPAEAAKPAPAKAKEEAKPGSARKGASNGNRHPAARAGSSKSRTKGRGCLVPPETEAASEPSPTTQDGACAPSAVASSAPSAGTSGAGPDPGLAADGAVCSPDAACLGSAGAPPAAAEPTAAAASGFSLALFDSEGGAS